MALIAAGGAAQLGTIDNTIYFELRNASDNLETTSKVAADMTIRWLRNGQAPQTLSPSNLASVTAAHVDGGVIALDNTNMKGQYRLDLPDAAFSPIGTPTPSLLLVTITVSGSWVVPREIPLTSAALPWTVDQTLGNLIADYVLLRDWALIQGTVPSFCQLQAGRGTRNTWGILVGSPSKYQVFKENGALAWEGTISESGASVPITGVTTS